MTIAPSRQRAPRPAPTPIDATTPYSLAVAGRSPKRGDTDLLNAISSRLEAQANALGDLGIFIVALQDAERMASLDERIYSELARRVAFTGFLGRGVDPEPVPGAYGVDLAPQDPLNREWTMVVLGPHEATVLCAQQVQETSKDPVRRFDYVLSHDRDLVEEVARLLAHRFTPRDAIPRTTALVH